MADFETAYRNWMDMHLSRRRGERLRRLKEGHGYGEKLLLEQVWWPVVGHFDFLHPEYEVMDEDGNYYDLDFAYLRDPKPTDLESDGFNPHARDADRNTFKKGRRRQNAIALYGWNILRFSTDDIRDDPEHCRQTLRRMFQRWYGEDRVEWTSLPFHKREIMRVAIRSAAPIRASDVAASLESGLGLARKLLRELAADGWLEPVSGTKRIHRYRVADRIGTRKHPLNSYRQDSRFR